MSDNIHNLIRRRTEALRREMKASNVPCYISGGLSNIYYLTNYLETGEANIFMLIPLDSDPVLFVPRMNYARALENAVGCYVEPIEAGEKFSEKISEKIREMHVKQVFFDELSAVSYKSIKKSLDKQLLEPKPDIFQRLRQVKDEAEMRLLIKAAELSALGAKTALETLRAGLREFEVAAEAEYAMRKRGSDGVAFETIVASGSRSAYPHGECGRRRIKNGDAVIVDIGANYRGYKSDITRTKFIGTPSAEQLHAYTVVYSAYEEVSKNVKPGMVGKDIDGIARGIIEREGYGKYFLHGLGHGVGIDIHESPWLTVRSNDYIVEKNVITLEPGIYIPHKFGIRIEDTVRVTKDGITVLTQLAKNIY
ncbi:MAG: Xaa-Pro peptidase family protein [Candidatus Bathyarchaeota archaeon]